MSERFDEKATDVQVDGTLSPSLDEKHGHGGITQGLQQSDFAMATAEAKRLGISLNPWSARSFQLYAICICCFLNATVNGFDGSLMGSINAMTQYKSFFGLSETGSTTGIVFVLYNFGNIAGSFMSGVIMDYLGRRAGMQIGALVTIAGTAVITSSQNLHQFMAGRFLLGVGVSIQITSAPSYVTEIVPPQWRGRLGGAYNTFYYTGSIVATGVVYATNKMSGNIAWRLPLGMQLGAPLAIFISCFFIPESPRFLTARGKIEEAKLIIARYHGGDSLAHPLVLLQIREFEEGIKVEKASKPWDYSGLYNSRGARWRLVCVSMMSFFSQLCGNAILSYYLPTMFKNLGITSTDKRLLLTFANAIVSFSGAILGAIMNDTIGRRPRFIGGTLVLAIILGVVTGMSALSLDPGKNNSHVANAGIAFIFLFGFAFSWVYTPNQSLYCCEVLDTANRPKGMALHTLQANLAGVLNTYVSALALEAIEYKYYFVWIAFDVVQAVCWYLWGVETRGRTLEEMDAVFADPNPVKASKHIVKLDINENNEIRQNA